jgi:phenylpropionate dioxygenase-like ring-hydroxylating dioxygenase large terminal subunit
VDRDRFYIAFPRRRWYPAALSRELGRRQPLAATLMDTPLVVFRDARGAPVVLLDRCPHRNYPLSAGQVTRGGALECGYHGWTFDGCGACVRVPGVLDASAEPAGARSVPSYPTSEQDGIVWVWGDPHVEPRGSPFRLPVVEGDRAGEVIFRRDLECTLHAALENSLDVPHTAFLHRGLFRGRAPHTITAVRRPLDDGVEVQYFGEPVGIGPIRLDRGTGRTFDHWDRFFLPSIAQIEYAVDGWFRIVNTILHLPLAPFRTRAWFVVRFESRLPAAVVGPFVRWRGRQILSQDERALARQSERIRAFDGARFASSELDVLGPVIWHLLRHAERSEAAGNSRDEADDDGRRSIAERTVVFDA